MIRAAQPPHAPAPVRASARLSGTTILNDPACLATSKPGQDNASNYDWLSFPYWYEAISFFESENMGEFVSCWLKARDPKLASMVLLKIPEFIAVLCKVRKEARQIEHVPVQISPPRLGSRCCSRAQSKARRPRWR